MVELTENVDSQIDTLVTSSSVDQYPLISAVAKSGAAGQNQCMQERRTVISAVSASLVVPVLATSKQVSSVATSVYPHACANNAKYVTHAPGIFYAIVTMVTITTWPPGTRVIFESTYVPTPPLRSSPTVLGARKCFFVWVSF